MAHYQAMVLAHSGRLRLAHTMWLHAIDLARQKKDREASAMYQAGAALSEAHAGNGAEACRRAKAALEESRARDVVFGSLKPSSRQMGERSQLQASGPGMERL